MGLRAIGLYCRLFVDLGRKELRGPTPAEHLEALRTLFLDLQLGELPAWIERLSFAPPLLAALRELLEALARRDAVTGTIGLDPDRFTAIGRTVLRSIPNAETLAQLAAKGQPAPGPEVEDSRTALITRFANDVALRSYTLTSDRVDELRAANLDDAEILDLVVTVALWSSAARLEVLTACLPAMEPSDENTVPGQRIRARFSRLRSFSRNGKTGPCIQSSPGPAGPGRRLVEAEILQEGGGDL
jgi:alkylhydroperoxidase family enzyme